MATLERIRQRSGLLIVIIGVAMLAFILTDLLGSGNSILRADANVVGVVDGRTVESPEFSRKMEELRQRVLQQNPQQAAFLTNTQLAEGVWNEIVREKLMQEQYDKLGISISAAELYDRLKSNPSIQGAPLFQDQVTGQFSEGLLQQYINNIEANRGLDPEAATAYTQWIEFEQSEKTSSLQRKYFAAIEKGLYYPKALGKDFFERQNTNADVRLMALEYATIADSTIKLTDSDYSKYYNAHKEEFKTEKSASIEFVTFDVQPSEADRNAINNELAEYIGDSIPNLDANGDTIENFTFNQGDSSFASSLSDTRGFPEYYNKTNLPSGLDSTILEKPVGHIVGPYETQGYFVITKVIGKKVMADSVHARHILLSYAGLENGNQSRSGLQAKKLADSLVEVFKADTSLFATTAMQLSDDKGSAIQGGDLSWFGNRQMVRPFSNFCFKNEVGAVGVVQSQFGFHVIEILGQKGETPSVKLVSINREITESEETLNDIYSAAGNFASSVTSADDFAAKAVEMGYSPRVATDMKVFDENIAGLGANRDVVKWANGVGFSYEESAVGDVQLFTNSAPYVVAIITERNEEGTKSLANAKDLMTPKVLKEKKAEQLIAKMNEASANTNDINEIAKNLGITHNAHKINFMNSTIPGFGNEPKVVGYITGLEAGKTSKPIKGENGVYMVEVSGINPAPADVDYTDAAESQAQGIKGRVNSEVFTSLKETADIDDRRAKFY